MVLLDLHVSRYYLQHFRTWLIETGRIYNGVAFIGILLFYFPEKVHQALPGPKMEIVKRIDFVGAFLSIAGAVLL